MKKRKEFLKKIRNRLWLRREDLSKQIEFQSNDKAFDEQVKDKGDEALYLSMEKVQASLQEAEINELKLIDQAIERIDKGEYGVCIDCEEHISDARLEYYPYAARCIVCQEALEE